MSDKTGLAIMLLRWAAALAIVLTPLVPNSCFVQWDSSPVQRTRQVIEAAKDNRERASERIREIMGKGG